MITRITTRELIIETTKQLCNEHRAYNITTNHIAEQMNISSGNLYYHFKNKEEIIREIYIDNFEKADRIWREPDFWTSEDGIVHFLVELNILLNEYLFCYRDINVLLSRDLELKELYVARLLRRTNFLNQTFAAWEINGIMRPFHSDESRANAATNFNLILQSWVSYYDILNDKITPDLICEGTNRSITFFDPYFDPETLNRIKKRIEATIKPCGPKSEKSIWVHQ